MLVRVDLADLLRLSTSSTGMQKQGPHPSRSASLSQVEIFNKWILFARVA